ncbi:hypothetical protein GCM10027605_14140 [Micromonospora zhanjiangensis]
MLVPSAAYADYWGNETNKAVSSGAPSGHYYECRSVAGATACFMPYGDKFYVRDDSADGHSAAANWTFDGPDGYRTGACVNQLGNGHWGVCNKDFAEGYSIRVWPAVYENGNQIRAGVTVWMAT